MRLAFLCNTDKELTFVHLYFESPKALLLHFKRFIVTQEVRAPLKTSDENEEAPAPVMEMVLKKNKVRNNVLDYLDTFPILYTHSHCKIERQE